jgi:O-antigen/teichoic acid export membrane protein
LSTLKRVATNTFFYTASSLLLRASSLIFFPIFSLYLTKADYGILSITQSIGSFVILFSGLELGKALTRFIFNSNPDNKEGHNTLIYSCLVGSFLFGSLLVLFLSLTGSFILKPLLNDIPFYPYVLIFLLSIPFNSIIDTCRVYQKATHQGYNAFLLDTSFFSSNILMNLLFVVVLKMDVIGIIISILLNTLLFSVLLYFLFYRKLKFNFDKNILKDAFSYSLPLIPYALLNILFESIDKFFLNADSGAQTSGIYYIALTFASIFSTVKESTINAFTPWLFGNIKTQSEKYLSGIISSIYIALGIMAIGISWFSKEILMLLSSNPDFVEAYKYIPMTVLGLYVIFLGQLYNIKTFYYGRYNRYLFIATMVGIIADIAGCYLLIEKYNIYGAVAARVIAFAVHVIALIFFSSLETEKREIYNTSKLILTLFLISITLSLPLVVELTAEIFIIKAIAYFFVIVFMLYYAEKKFQFLSNYLKKNRTI